MGKPRIFISYSSKNRVQAEAIHKSLEAVGAVWRDQTRLETNWSREIAFALADSDLLCLLWSADAATSKWVKHEWLTMARDSYNWRSATVIIPDF
jgi:TIR domain